MSRDVVFVKYNTSDKLKYKYTSISESRYIEMSRDVVFVPHNTSDKLRYKYASISIPDI